MAFPFDVKTHTRAVPGLPGESADAVRMTQIESDLATALAMPSIEQLDDIPDVDTTGVADGETLIYDSAANGGLGGYVTGTTTGAVAFIKHGANLVMTDADRFNFGGGLDVQQDGGIPTQANVFVTFAGTGANNAAARSDHTHTQASMATAQYAAKGSHSSGVLTLASLNVTLADGVPYLVRADLQSKQRANGSESAYYFLRLMCNGSPDDTQETQCVGFVPDPQSHTHGWQITGTGAAATVTAQIIYSHGVPVLVDAGQLIVTLIPAR